MDDRQEAIDILTRMSTNHFYGHREQEAFKLAAEALSVQPEIIHCENCKHYNAGFECLIEGYGVERNKDWFCGDAERRTDE